MNSDRTKAIGIKQKAFFWPNDSEDQMFTFTIVKRALNLLGGVKKAITLARGLKKSQPIAFKCPSQKTSNRISLTNSEFSHFS